jgi:hypothetical protein
VHAIALLVAATIFRLSEKESIFRPLLLILVVIFCVSSCSCGFWLGSLDGRRAKVELRAEKKHPLVFYIPIPLKRFQLDDHLPPPPRYEDVIADSGNKYARPPPSLFVDDGNLYSP